MNKLPFLVSIPHCGSEIPPELKEANTLSAEEILLDGDAYTDIIYDCGDIAAAMAKAEIARAFVDLNRAVGDMPPVNPDGVVKTKTIFGKKIYNKDIHTDKNLCENLIEKFYEPYHYTVKKFLKENEILLALDCHSMEPCAPAIADKPGEPRPLMCISDNYGKACPESLFNVVFDSLKSAFEFKEGEILRNIPFKGGYLTRRYGMKPAPWIQIELNRNLFLYCDNKKMCAEPDLVIKAKSINKKFREALIMISDKIRS